MKGDRGQQLNLSPVTCPLFPLTYSLAWYNSCIRLRKHVIVSTFMQLSPQRYFIGLCLVVLCACAGSRPYESAPAPTLRPIPTLRPTRALQPTHDVDSNAPDSGWIFGQSGIEVRTLQLDLAERRGSISIVRVDPGQVRLRVGYAPDSPNTLDTWTQQTAPLLLVNGGFFDENNKATALLISDGVANGASYQGFGGMFTVAGDGSVGIQPLRDQAYDPAVELDQALQSFPMLIFPGGASADVKWNDERDRRTALALDRTGRLLIIVCPQASFSLNEFAAWLQQSDLEIDRALNLDGGASTGLYVDAGAAQERIEPFSRLPIVLYAQPIQ